MVSPLHMWQDRLTTPWERLYIKQQTEKYTKLMLGSDFNHCDGFLPSALDGCSHNIAAIHFESESTCGANFRHFVCAMYLVHCTKTGGFLLRNP